jgi:predicted DNA-binding protein
MKIQNYTTSFRLSEKLLKSLKKISKKLNMHRSQIIKLAIEQFIERNK